MPTKREMIRTLRAHREAVEAACVRHHCYRCRDGTYLHQYLDPGGEIYICCNCGQVLTAFALYKRVSSELED